MAGASLLTSAFGPCPVMLPLKLERGQYGGGRHRLTPRDVFGGLVPDVHQITVTRAHAGDNRTAEGSPPLHVPGEFQSG